MHGLLGTGIIGWARLDELHASNNVLNEEDRAKVERSMRAVRAMDA